MKNKVCNKRLSQTIFKFGKSIVLLIKLTYIAKFMQLGLRQNVTYG